MEEIWLPIIGYEGLYEVSNLGRVKSLPKTWMCCLNCLRYKGETIMKQCNVSEGYSGVSLQCNSIKKLHLVHRIVAEAWVDNTLHKLQVNHKDGDKKNNRADNLEWVTHVENVSHACKSNLMLIGEMHPMAKLNNSDILDIRLSLKNGSMSKKELAIKYNVGEANISVIARRVNWKHIA
jgi:hypothetical protein